jgi:phospholipase C
MAMTRGIRSSFTARLGLTVALVFGTGLFSCSKSDQPSNSEPTQQELPGPSEWNRPVTPPEDDQAELARKSCTYQAGSLAAETQGKSHPSGANIPVDHVVVLMMENRSFDHYFQKAKEAGMDVDVAPDGFTNPDSEGKAIAPFHDTLHCFVDTSHSYGSVTQQVGSGKMNGFVMASDNNHEIPAQGTVDMLKGDRAMGYYTEEDLPFTYWMARNFSISDRYFASAPTSTWPNRMFLYSATSFGLKSNSFPPEGAINIIDLLNQRKISWKIYASGAPTVALYVSKFLEYNSSEEKLLNGIEEFYADAAAGTLPQVIFLDPDGTSSKVYTRSDEHPPAPAMVGQNWIGKAVEALVKSSAWPRSAMFITYDEHGGLYDHVVPPAACPPDDMPLKDTNPPAQFDHYGIRVPFFLISPYAKKGFVSHRTYDHTSITRFLEARFVLPAMTRRDANAEIPWDMFDFENPPNLQPPQVPVPEINQDIVEKCKAIWHLSAIRITTFFLGWRRDDASE